MLDFRVDERTCTRCGEYIEDCPARIVAMTRADRHR